MTVLWDGRTRVYVTAPTSLMGHTQGLCGTFDNNQNNDLMTREHIVENNANRFGNSWKTQASCRDVPDVIPPSPCDSNPQRRQQAQDLCDKLKSSVFSGRSTGWGHCVRTCVGMSVAVCDSNPQRNQQAQDLCDKLKSNISSGRSVGWGY